MGRIEELEQRINRLAVRHDQLADEVRQIRRQNRDLLRKLGGTDPVFALAYQQALAEGRAARV